MITRKNEAAGLPSATPARQRNYNAASRSSWQRRQVLRRIGRCAIYPPPLSLTSLIVAYSKRTGTLVLCNAVPVDERVRKEFVCLAMLKEQTKSTYFIAETSDYLNTRGFESSEGKRRRANIKALANEPQLPSARLAPRIRPV
jgi:hypothetical protein